VFIGIYNLSGTQARRRLTFGGHNTNPLWTRDGLRIIFQSDREGDAGLFWQRVDGSGSAQRLTTPEKGVAHVADSASRTENVITVNDSSGAIWVLSLDDRKLKLLIPRPSTGYAGRAVFSPDGHWLAYQSSESNGTPQIYMQPFPPNGSHYQITQTGVNVFPLWSPDGKEIFYLTAGGRVRINSVDVRTQPSIEFSEPVSLPIEVNGDRRPYDISPNGSQFIAMLPPDEAQSGDRPPSQINTVLNWFSELTKKVPVK